MRTAIVTMCIGEKYLALWSRHAVSWRAYADRHGYALHVIDQPIDKSPRAQARSPAWQKCLVLGHPLLREFDRIVWVDADIVPTKNAPAVCDGVPAGKIGAVVSGDYLDLGSKAVFMQRWNGRPTVHVDVGPLWAADQKAWYDLAGVTCSRTDVLQTGVLVLEPMHRELLEHAYAVDLPPNSKLPYEQVHLSAEIINRGLHHALDPRFNLVLFERLVVHYPYLLNPSVPYFDDLAHLAVTTECANGFFVHFAYRQEMMRYIHPAALFGFEE